MVFERPVRVDGKNLKVEIAFKIAIQEGNQESIIPIEGAKLAAFFLTGKRTDLKFLIQGPFRTTPTRDTIPLDDEWNKELIGEIAILVAESIPKIKELGLLNVEFLKTLPIDTKVFLEVNDAFEPVYKRVKEKFKSNEELLPTYDGGYVSAQKALIARGEDLRDLLSSEQLKMLFNGTKWLDENITKDKTPELRKYLMEELVVAEIDPERFAREFTEDFIKKQSDEWVKRFYVFLLKQEALWREKTYFERGGILRSKSIIRLDDDSHTRPFDSDGEPRVYLPSVLETGYRTVKKSLFEDEQVKKFLRNLGLKGVDITDYIDSNILSKYSQEEVEISPEKNINDVKQIFQRLEDMASDEMKHKLLKKLKETPFLIALNYENSKGTYKKPSDIYLGEQYTEDKHLDIYFEGNREAWYLAEIYRSIIDVATLKELSCKTKIHIIYREANWNGHVTIRNARADYARGLNDFDPDCEIDGFEYALENINIERAKIIWNILKKDYKRIYGTVESATRQDWSNSTEEEIFSEMGKLLRSYPWLPDTEGNFHKPSEILLSELHGEFDKESLDAKCVAEELKFRTVEEDQFLKQLPIAKRKRYERVDKLYQIMSEEKMDKILEKMIEQNWVKKDDFTAQDVTTKFKESLVTSESSSTDSTQDGGWNGLTPDEEEQIRKAYGNEFSGRVERTHIIREPKIITGSKIEDIINPQEFLYEQYKGHCQICNTRLDLGPIKRPYFEVFRIRETQGKNPETNMEFNVLCLCPNCHALMKHGGRDLESVWETAEKVSKREVAPEEVGERSGDFYIINVKVAGKEREIFYTPTHMATIAAVVEQTTKKEEEPVLTAATAIQEDGNYEPVNDNKNQLQPLIKQAFEMAKRDDGWAYLTDLGNSLRKLDPCFNHRTYGYNKLNEMVRAYEDVLGLKIRYSPPKKEK